MAAQRAFFDMIAGKAPTVAVVAPPPAATAPASAAPQGRAAVAASGDAPLRTLRPGSILDIRV